MFDAWKQRQRQRLENRPERTVFYNIFATMMVGEKGLAAAAWSQDKFVAVGGD